MQQRRRLLLFSSVMGAAVWVWMAAWSLPDMFAGYWLRWGSPFIAATAAGILCWKFATHPIPGIDGQASIRRTLPAFLHRLFFIAAYAAMSLFPLMLFLILLTTSDFRHDGRVPVMWALLAGGFLIVTVVNSVGLAAFQRLKGTRAIAVLAIIGFCSLFASIMLLGSSPRLLDGVMRMSTIRVENVSLALDDKNCATVRMLGVTTSPAAAASGPSDGSCMLENATVISRVGERWVIACDRGDETTDQSVPRKRRNFRIEAKGVQAEIDASAEVQKRTGKLSLCS